MKNLKLYNKKDLISIIKKMGYDDRFGMYQRDYGIRLVAGLAGQVAFVDIDDFKALNTKCGYEQADRKIKQAFRDIQKTHIVFRFFSGDEIIIFKQGGIDRKALADCQKRIKFTACIGTVGTGTLLQVINKLSATVLRLKKTGRKGEII